MTLEEKILEVDPIIINGTAYITDSSFKKSVSEVFEYFEQQNTALQARIKELEEPKTCKSCKHIKFSSPLNDFVCKEGVANDVSKLGGGCITMPSVFNCSFYEPKDTK